MLGKVGFWIARAALDAVYQEHFAGPLRIRRAVADVATSGKRLKLQIAELEWPADTGQPPGRPKRRRNSHEYYRRCAERECNHRQRLRPRPWGPPAPKIAIVTCADPRLTSIEQMLGLAAGDVDMIRNFGTVIHDDAVRSLVLSTRLLGTREIMIINHTDCGMLRFTDSDLEARLRKETGRV